MCKWSSPNWNPAWKRCKPTKITDFHSAMSLALLSLPLPWSQGVACCFSWHKKHAKGVNRLRVWMVAKKCFRTSFLAWFASRIYLTQSVQHIKWYTAMIIHRYRCRHHQPQVTSWDHLWNRNPLQRCDPEATLMNVTHFSVCTKASIAQHSHKKTDNMPSGKWTNHLLHHISTNFNHHTPACVGTIRHGTSMICWLLVSAQVSCRPYRPWHNFANFRCGQKTLQTFYHQG